MHENPTSSPYVCLACEAELDHFSPICPSCTSAETVTRSEAFEQASQKSTRNRAQVASKVSATLPAKISTGRKAWDAVLEGGFVKPSSVLLHGPKGVGKSTSALRIGIHVAKLTNRKALYGSAEMPKEHLRMMLDKVGIPESDLKYLYINDSGNFEDMLEDILLLKPIVTIWDSIQRFKVEEEIGEIELRKVVIGAIELSNSVKGIGLLLSQVNKDDDFLGHNGIGHDTDVVLSLRKVGPNLISVECLEKNRFAPTPLTATEQLY